jgi:hypothetical protein
MRTLDEDSVMQVAIAFGVGFHRFSHSKAILPARRDRVEAGSQHVELFGSVVAAARVAARGAGLLEVDARVSGGGFGPQDVLALYDHRFLIAVHHLEVAPRILVNRGHAPHPGHLENMLL